MSPALEIGKRRGTRPVHRTCTQAMGSLRGRVTADGRLLEALRALALSYGTLWAFTLGAAALVWMTPGGPALARGVLRLSLSATRNPPPSVGGVVSIALNNSLHSVWPLLLGLVDAQRRRFTRELADGAVLANLLMAGLLVGGAIGGYGAQVLGFLPHVPLEWAGLAIGGAGWIVERRRDVEKHERTIAVALAMIALACGAVTESVLVPHR